MEKDHTKYEYFTADQIKKQIITYVMMTSGNRPLADAFCNGYDSEKEFARGVYNSLDIERIDISVNKKIVETYWRRLKG